MEMVAIEGLAEVMVVVVMMMVNLKKRKERKKVNSGLNDEEIVRYTTNYTEALRCGGQRMGEAWGKEQVRVDGVEEEEGGGDRGV